MLADMMLTIPQLKVLTRRKSKQIHLLGVADICGVEEGSRRWKRDANI